MRLTPVRATVVLVFALLIPASQAVAADEAPQGANVTPVAEAPTFAPGDTWTWTLGGDKLSTIRTETFLSQENDRLLFAIKAGEYERTRVRTRETNMIEDRATDGRVSNTRLPHSGILSFPLHVGKKWEQRYVNNGVHRWADYKVVAWEKVSTPAGEFDAFRVEGDDRRTDKQYGIKVTYWYAPAVKQFVRFIGIDSWNNSELASWSFDLVSYKVGR